jgi:hypothetical protein
MKVPCPTCGAVGDQPCRRGRKPRDIAVIGRPVSGFYDEAAIWRRNIPFPQGHDSRRTANASAQ